MRRNLGSTVLVVTLLALGTLAQGPASRALATSDPAPIHLNTPVGPELHRVWVHNIAGGDIRGSRDGGETWELIGHVVLPIEGGIWVPAVDNLVMAYNYLRGPSNVFATAVNNLHLRFSDPPGYELPNDVAIQPIPAHGVSIAPAQAKDEDLNDTQGRRRVALTDISGGKGIFSGEWSPRVGSMALMGDGENFAPMPYDVGPDSNDPARSHILIITEKPESELEYIEFENKKDGAVLVKMIGQEPTQVAKVTKPIKGIGRFGGSGFIQKPGHIRANHAGVIDIGTTDVNTDPDVPQTDPPASQDVNFFGSFQIVPSHHWQDESMKPNWGAEFAYLVVGPIIDPPSLVRYDLGVDGRAPLFQHALRAGTGTAYYKFAGDENWHETTEALKLGLFHRKDGTVLKHLRGLISDAFTGVARIRYQAD